MKKDHIIAWLALEGYALMVNKSWGSPYYFVTPEWEPNNWLGMYTYECQKNKGITDTWSNAHDQQRFTDSKIEACNWNVLKAKDLTALYTKITRRNK